MLVLDLRFLCLPDIKHDGFVAAHFPGANATNYDRELQRQRCKHLQRHELGQEPILRILNLQLQRQRCSRLERFSK
jgi:hypothetical protein